MKKIFLAMFLLVMSNVFSQEYKHQLSFASGTSFAIGDFGDKSIDNQYAGSAATGLNFYLMYGYKFSANTELSAKVFFNSNKLNTDVLLFELENATGYSWTNKPAHWSSVGFLFGPTAHIPISEKFIIDFHALAGYISMNSPELKCSSSYSSSLWIRMISSSAGSFCYNPGAGFTYFFCPQWSMLVSIDYMNARFVFDQLITYSSTGGSNIQEKVKVPFGVINTNVGISYNF